MISIINTFLLGCLCIEMIERRYPEHFRTILTDITFNAFYFYSKAQICFNKANKKLHDYIESNPTLSKIIHYIESKLTLSKNKTETHILGFSGMTIFIKNGELSDYDNCDFALFSQSHPDNKCANKMIIYGDINTPITMADVSDIKFMLIEITFREDTYKVYLKTDVFNFYLVGNIFTKSFFVYYLKQIISIREHIKDDDVIQLKIIDHNVDTLEITFTDKNESIILEQNGYKVINNDE